MSDRPIPFSELREQLVRSGWTFAFIWSPYRVFTKPDHLPILIEVTDGKVDIHDVKKIQAWLRGAGGA